MSSPVSVTKSQTKTSRRVKLNIIPKISLTPVYASWGCEIMCASNLWGGNLARRRLCMKYGAVSVSAQNKGGG